MKRNNNSLVMTIIFDKNSSQKAIQLTEKEILELNNQVQIPKDLQ